MLFLQDFFDSMMALVDMGSNVFHMVTQITTWTTTLGVLSIPVDAFESFAQALIGIATALWDGYLNNLFWANVQAALYCKCPMDGVWTWEAIGSVATELGQYIGEDNPFYTILVLLLELIGPDGANNTRHHYHASGGDCDNIECMWHVRLDFQIEDGGFVAAHNPPHLPEGEWIQDGDWQQALYIPGDDYSYRMDLSIRWPSPCDLWKFKVNGSFPFKMPTIGYTGLSIGTWRPAFEWVGEWSKNAENGGNFEYLGIEQREDCTGLRLLFTDMWDPMGSIGWIVWMEIWGFGPCPWPNNIVEE